MTDEVFGPAGMVDTAFEARDDESIATVGELLRLVGGFSPEA